MRLPAINNLILKNIKKEEYEKYIGLMPDFKKEKTQKFTTIVLTLTASIILGLFAVSPTLSTIAGLRKQLEDDRFVEQKLQQKINNLSVLQQKYASIEPDLTLVYEAIPKTSQIPLMLGEIQTLASESNVSLSNFQTLPVNVSKEGAVGKKSSSYDFSFTTLGTYQDMLKFMDKLVNFQRIITIENISITKPTSINATSLQLNIKGAAFFKE